MRLVALLIALLAVPFVGIVLVTNVFRPPPAADRLEGVFLTITGHSTEDLGDGRHRLRLYVEIASRRNVEECLGFALDMPFAGRRMQPESGGCLRPAAGRQAASLVFDKLTDDDLVFPSHTLVWGIPGGRCGPILELLGVCVVEQAGTADFDLPTKSVVPTFRPGETFPPLFSFYPLP